MSVYSVSLPGPGPYGFRLQGGKDFNTPLTIARLNDGGKAAQALIGIGDKVLSIDGIKADGITHLDAQNMIKACAGNLNMTLQKASAAPSTPQKEQKETTVTKQNPVKRPPRKHIVDTYTDIYHIPSHAEDSKTRLMDNTEDWHPRTGTTQSRSFRILAQITGTENLTEAEPDDTKKTNTFAEVSNGLDAPMPSKPATQSVSTRTSVHQEVAETPLTPETAVRLDSSSFRSPLAEPLLASPAPLPPPLVSSKSDAASLSTSTSTSPRKQLFENPLETLPKGAPFPPPLMQVLKLDRHVATVTKIASSLTRSRKPVRDPAFLTAGPDVPSGMTNRAADQSFAALKCTVATQTPESADHRLSSTGSPCAVQTQTPTAPERYPGDRHFSVPPSAEKAGPVPETPGYQAKSAGSNFSKSVLMENPLESLPKSSPLPAPLVSLPNLRPVDRESAVAAVSAAVGVQARLFDPSPYRALLDALLITPITKPSLPYQKHTRKSTGAIHRVGDISETLEPVNSGAYSVATSKSMPKGPENANKPAFAQTASTTFTRPSAPMGTVKSTGWQPISQATPATGQISNASPHAGTAPNNKKPWTQPNPSEQDTLVQKAEHIPAGTRTPMCAHCDMVIRGPFLLALGKSWHPEEFNCAHCKKSMADSGFVQEKGALYCDLCYGKFFAPECARCHRKILGEVINALKQTWHVTCFVCVACSQPIRSSTFHMEDGDPYCETDYYSLFGTMCHGCEFPIEAGDRFLDALGSTWHDTCFVCTVCCESLEGQTFFSKKDKPLCKKHAHAVNM